MYLFSQTVLYINPPQIILLANLEKKVSAELYRLSGGQFAAILNPICTAVTNADVYLQREPVSPLHAFVIDSSIY